MGRHQEDKKSPKSLPRADTGVSKELTGPQSQDLAPEGAKRNGTEGAEYTRLDVIDLIEEKDGHLLDHDDAYWDTLSTIASTTKDKSSDSDQYMYEAVIPGPIPVEITTTASKDIEVKDKNALASATKKASSSGGKSHPSKLARTGSVLSGDEQIQSPPPHGPKNDDSNDSNLHRRPLWSTRRTVELIDDRYKCVTHPYPSCRKIHI